MTDFTIFYKRTLEDDNDWAKLPQYDLFISTFDDSDRVKNNFDKINSKEKHWLITPHHKIPKEKTPKIGRLFFYDLFNDDDYIHAYLSEIKEIYEGASTICIDITGFIRPFIVFLFRYLASVGIKKIDVIYGEPNKYVNSEETKFSGFVDIVKPVPSCAATDVLPVSEDDVLIIATGYDDKLISEVAKSKKYCGIKYQIFGFPSLQADMYQENVLKVYNSREAIGNEAITLFAPAFDPFVTAQILKETIDGYLTRQKANFYLSPLSTKPQVLGFILYFLYEGINNPVSIIFPYSNHYSINTCKGVNKTWLYNVELP